jgi:hypothetical protein
MIEKKRNIFNEEQHRFNYATEQEKESQYFNNNKVTRRIRV